MKNIKFIAIAIVSLLMLSSCDKHDSLDDAVFVGKMAPHVYWELGSSTVNAGSAVPFTVQYYTTGTSEIDHSEVWYNVIEDESKVVSCPWTQTFTYSISSNKSLEKRISQKISDYVHNTSYWNDSLRAFTFKASFPTSTTLSTISWVKPNAFDTDKMNKYFGTGFMKQFKDSLYKMMKVADFQKMYLGLNLVTNFKIYVDSVANPKTGGYDYYFPKDASGNRPVPATIASIYETIPFSDLIYNKSTSAYDVEFTRSYKIKAKIKVFDKEGNTGIGLSQDISLN